jgi:hypothetical protein
MLLLARSTRGVPIIQTGLFSIEFVVALQLESSASRNESSPSRKQERTIHSLLGEGFNLFRSIVFNRLLGGTALIDGPQVGRLHLAAGFGAIGPTW